MRLLLYGSCKCFIEPNKADTPGGGGVWVLSAASAPFARQLNTAVLLWCLGRQRQALGRAETCSAGGGGGGTGALRRWGGGWVGKMGFRAGTLCYVVLAVLVQILPATKSVVGWHDTPADG